jgi:hypothetical protein
MSEQRLVDPWGITVGGALKDCCGWGRSLPGRTEKAGGCL